MTAPYANRGPLLYRYKFKNEAMHRATSCAQPSVEHHPPESRSLLRPHCAHQSVYELSLACLYLIPSESGCPALPRGESC
jgi:hypothetical protein